MEIACTFLPNDCPLVRHIQLSYSTYYTGNKSKSDAEAMKSTIKPLRGIQNKK